MLYGTAIETILSDDELIRGSNTGTVYTQSNQRIASGGRLTVSTEPIKEQLSLDSAVRHILEECRMVLPGIQALFGFQLIAVFNEGFAQKLSTVQLLILSMFPLAISICLEIYLIAQIIMRLYWLSLLTAAGLFLLFLSLWTVLPHIEKGKN